uniref:Uncharacterized protein n=1 Tax=Rhizophora mucronata TaxID=61149 RepID=A0A2P2NKG4_RHIMU
MNSQLSNPFCLPRSQKHLTRNLLPLNSKQSINIRRNVGVKAGLAFRPHLTNNWHWLQAFIGDPVLSFF